MSDQATSSKVDDVNEQVHWGTKILVPGPFEEVVERLAGLELGGHQVLFDISKSNHSIWTSMSKVPNLEMTESDALLDNHIGKRTNSSLFLCIPSDNIFLLILNSAATKPKQSFLLIKTMNRKVRVVPTNSESKYSDQLRKCFSEFGLLQWFLDRRIAVTGPKLIF